MSRVSPAFHFSFVLLTSAAAFAAASPVLAQSELRRLPISFERPANRLKDTHRLTAPHQRTHKRTTPLLSKNEVLARAANLLTIGGYADIKSLHTEGDHVAAEVGEGSVVRDLIVTANGAITEDPAAIATTPTHEAPPAQLGEAAGNTSEAASPGALSASNSMP